MIYFHLPLSLGLQVPLAILDEIQLHVHLGDARRLAGKWPELKNRLVALLQQPRQPADLALDPSTDMNKRA